MELQKNKTEQLSDQQALWIKNISSWDEMVYRLHPNTQLVSFFLLC
jgi:hypothetical protein